MKRSSSDSLLDGRARYPRGRRGIAAEGQGAAPGTGFVDARDIALLAAARRAERFETAAYTAAGGTAHAIGREADVFVRGAVLEEERRTDRSLSVGRPGVHETCGRRGGGRSSRPLFRAAPLNKEDGHVSLRRQVR
jgi:hypothetical protein